MKLVTYRATVEAEARLGAIKDDLIIDVESLGDVHGADMRDTMLDMIDAGKPALAELREMLASDAVPVNTCLLYTSPSPRDATLSRMPSSA